VELDSTCPLSVASTLWRSSASVWVQTIVYKATFDLLPGRAKLSERQEPIHEDDQLWDDDPARSLYAPGDLVPLKARADVLLVGRAFAPGGRPVHSFVVRLGVGKLVKAIEVFGARTWDASGHLHQGAPFSSMSLAYEHAAGGPDTWNPVGMPLDAPPDAQGGVALPNLQPLHQKLARRGDFIPPIGFGPISAASPLRAHLLGHLRESFSAACLREEPLPEGFDPAYFNAAPPDQQVEEIHADEQLLFENLHREHARLSTCLPGSQPRVLLELPGAPAQRLRMRGDTMWIDTDRAIVTVTWRGQVPLRTLDQAGRVVIDLEDGEQEEASAPERATEQLAMPLPAQAAVTVQLLGGAAVRGAELPFLQAEPAREAPRPPERLAPPPPMSVGQVVASRPAAHEVAPLPVLIPPGGGKEAGFAGVQAASDAAAGASPKAEKRAAPAVPEPAAKSARERPREILELLWYDPAALPRIRRNLAWKKIISELKPRPSDDDFDGGLPPEQMKAAKDKRDVFGVLARGEVMDLEGIRRAMEMAVLDDGSFVPPYVLTAGVLEFLFDEMETLKATLVAVAPFVPGDKKLKEAVDYVNEVMKTPGLERARGVVEGLCAKVKAAFGQAGRGVAAGYLEELVEGMLLEGRCYQKRTVMGGRWIRARFTPTGAEDAIPAYLHEALEKALPGRPRVTTRVIVDASTDGDHGPAPTVMLRVAALARLLSR
jgi:hypothetical protein